MKHPQLSFGKSAPYRADWADSLVDFVAIFLDGQCIGHLACHLGDRKRDMEYWLESNHPLGRFMPLRLKPTPLGLKAAKLAVARALAVYLEEDAR